DMQSTRPGGLAVSVDLKILKELVESLSHLYHLLEVILIRGIQVYHDVIRLVERADPGVPGVDLDAAKVCHVDQSRLFLTKHVVDVFISGFRMDAGSFDPVRVSFWSIFLIKAVFINPIGVAVKILRPILQERKDMIGD